MKLFYSKYRGFFRCAVKRKLAYRGAVLTGWLSGAVGLIVSLFVWRLLFKEHNHIAGYDWNQMVLYALIAAFLRSILSYSSERQLSLKVLTGSIATDLIKPVDFQKMCFYESSGSALVEGTVSLIIVSVLAVFLTDPLSYLIFPRILFFFISVLLAYSLTFILAYLGGLMCFYTSNGYGVVYLRQIITDVFSGALLPLAFFPKNFQTLASYLPFQSTLDTPTQIFLGRVEGMDVIRLLAIQLFWVILLWFAAKAVFRKAVKVLTIQGG
jgi:ABC-2 type transport system permease protein